MKLLAIIVAVLVGLIAFSIAHPYMNGVAYTHQRECERAALLDIAYEIANLRYDDQPDAESKTIRQIVHDAPKPTDIDESRFGVTMAWDIVDRDDFQIGGIDKTILLFPDAIPSAIHDSTTPLIAHVSSSFTTRNDNCVLLVLPTAEISSLNLTDTELEQLMGCLTPADAANWLKSHFGER